MAVTTRNQQVQQQQGKRKDTKREEGESPSPSPQKKQKATPDHSSSSGSKNEQDNGSSSSSSSSSKYQPKTNNSYAIAKNAKNQPLLDKLDELANAMFAAAEYTDTNDRTSNSNNNSKNHFKGIAIKNAVRALAKLDYEIPNGKAVSQGKNKVPGVGAGTASYIDEFMSTGGEIKEIDDFAKTAEQADKKQGQEKKASTPSKKQAKSTTTTTGTSGTRDKNTISKEDHDVIEINRAPVLTLWVTVVAQREGYSREEAVTYGKWVATVFAQSKGRALGKFDTSKGPPAEEQQAKTPKDDENKKKEPDHVVAFGNKKIPVVTDDQGNRLAVLQGQPVDPAMVEDYLVRKFGNADNLRETQDAMQELADNMELDELQQQAYDLYTQIRPQWKGWGKKAALDLDEIREMAH